MKTTLRIFAKIALALLAVAGIAMIFSFDQGERVTWVNLAGLLPLYLAGKGADALDNLDNSKKSNR